MHPMRWVATSCLALMLPACAPPASTGGINSDNPASKLYGITRADSLNDVPVLVEQLDHDDPAVRMMAIHALERITGERLGYNPYANLVERRPAVEAWEQAVRSGRFTAAENR